MAQDESLRGGKSRPEGVKISPGGAAAPPLSAPMQKTYYNWYPVINKFTIYIVYFLYAIFVTSRLLYNLKQPFSINHEMYIKAMNLTIKKHSNNG